MKKKQKSYAFYLNYDVRISLPCPLKHHIYGINLHHFDSNFHSYYVSKKMPVIDPIFEILIEFQSVQPVSGHSGVDGRTAQDPRRTLMSILSSSQEVRHQKTEDRELGLMAR